jgi:hypothetical protein
VLSISAQINPIQRDRLIASLMDMSKSAPLVIKRAIKQSLSDIHSYAKKNHRFTTRGGMLEHSITDLPSPSGLSGIVYLEQGQAPYARRIHEGGGGKKDSLGRRMTNKPDRFLYQAFAFLKSKIQQNINDAVIAFIAGAKRA